ncbi:7625_t:CDS:1 [Funneliformis geosporum]|uniref:7625_t:CDS:1 n=1 Tax=Funneliformis geosporum TaxID=1117311 RepID=A0A9W4X9R8_9GLOM|nr:7625_t:CDS:1 [Funneliformis geosporum]
MSDKTAVPNKPETSDKSKLDKLLEGGNITLNCLIPGEEARDIFEVTISNANNNRVSSLGVEIRNRRLDLFRDIDSSRLVLYKVRDSMSDNTIIINLRNDNVAVLVGTELMNPQNTIYSYFPTQPQPIYAGEKGINVIIYPPRNN